MKFTPVYSARYGDQFIRDLFFEKKYPQKRCDFCNSSNVYFVDEENTKLRCRDCWKRSSLTHNTYLESTKLSLRFWYEVIWSFVLDHPSSKAKKLLNTSNHQTVLRIYRAIRRALYEERGSLYKEREQGLNRDVTPDDELKEVIGEYVDGLEGKNHPIYGIYRGEGGLRLRLLNDAAGLHPGGGSSVIGPEVDYDLDALIGFGCLFHGKGEYLQEDRGIHLEGLWNFTKSHMQLYQGVRRENWGYYLKEIEYKYNSRKKPYEKQVEELVGYLMNQDGFPGVRSGKKEG